MICALFRVRKPPLFLALVTFCLLALPVYSGTASAAGAVENATVLIVTPATRDGKQGLAAGSGFHIGGGYFVTNAHVVENSSAVYLVNSVLPWSEAKIVATELDFPASAFEARKDYALLKIDPSLAASLPALPFTFNFRVGDSLTALGYPGVSLPDRWRNALKAGNIGALKALPPPAVFSRKGKIKIVTGDDHATLHFSAFSDQGGSGGPLVSERGEVQGLLLGGLPSAVDLYKLMGMELPEEGTSIGKSGIGLAFFLMDNGVTPLVAPGQALPSRDPPGVSIAAPEGWTVLDAYGDSAGRMFFAESEKGQSGPQVTIRISRLYQSAADEAWADYRLTTNPEDDEDVRELTSATDGTEPKETSPGVHTFTYTDTGLEKFVRVSLFQARDAEGKALPWMVGFTARIDKEDGKKETLFRADVEKLLAGIRTGVQKSGKAAEVGGKDAGKGQAPPSQETRFSITAPEGWQVRDATADGDENAGKLFFAEEKEPPGGGPLVTIHFEPLSQPAENKAREAYEEYKKEKAYSKLTAPKETSPGVHTLTYTNTATGDFRRVSYFQARDAEGKALPWMVEFEVDVDVEYGKKESLFRADVEKLRASVRVK